MNIDKALSSLQQLADQVPHGEPTQARLPPTRARSKGRLRGGSTNLRVLQRFKLRFAGSC